MNPDELSEVILANLEGPYVGVMVYGSRVRGDFTEESDIDVLQLTEEPAPNYAKGLMVVNVRATWQLAGQCHDGDIYSLSLIREGRILADPAGVLAATLRGYLPPTDNYARKWREFEMRTALLDAVTPEAFEANRVAFVRAALYMLRNTAMIAYIRRFGEPCFSIHRMAEALDIPDLVDVFRGRVDVDNLTWERLITAKSLTRRFFTMATLDAAGAQPVTVGETRRGG